MRTIHLVLLVLPLISSPLQARELYISSGFTPPLTNLFERVLTELDRRLDSIEIIFKPMEGERSVKLVQAGFNDGDCCRVPAVFQSDERLIFVKPSFASIRWNAFVRNKNITISSFEELKPHAVGAVIGWKLAVNKIRKVAPEDYQILDTPEQMFRMLSKQRIDVGVIGYLSGLNVISELNLTNISAIQPPLAITPLHLMLSAKHRDIVPEIEAVLETMVRDGAIARIQESFEVDLLGR